MKTIYEAYRDNLVKDGGSPKFLDSIRRLLSKWVAAAGGIPRPGDTKNVLLQKLARAKGVTPFPGDTDIAILRRIADGNSTDNEWWCLRKIAEGVSDAPGSFSLNAASNLTTTSPGAFTFDLSWLASSGATGYIVELSFTGDFLDGLPDSGNLGNVLSNANMPWYDFLTPLYARVRAVNSIGSSISNVISIVHP